jgi:hypothetical protein
MGSDSGKTQRVVERLRAQRIMVDGVLIHPRAKHGTVYGYNRFSCQCRACRDANRERQRQWRAARRGVVED